MTFLQPLILFGLPLILLPVIIHLLNRMRHRNQPWAAMRFLLTANRTSTSHAKLRQWLVLLFRVLAVLMLLLFLSRPLAGGWLGWALAPAPDAIVILLDRSASMESRGPGETESKRQQALHLLSDAAKKYESSHLVLIENVFRSAQTISNAGALSDLSWTEPTDTAADLPAMMQSAFDWLVENRAGAAEIWIASDLQRSNWNPEDDRWTAVISSLNSLPQKVRVRLLAFNQDNAPNALVAVHELTRRKRSGETELSLVLDFMRNQATAATLPVTLVLDGARTQVEVPLEGHQMRWRHTLPLGEKKTGGWGMVELPADSNPRDNTAYFVYGAEKMLRAAVVASDSFSGRLLQLAGAASGSGQRQTAELMTPGELTHANWNDYSLIIWQAPLPDSRTEQRLQSFIAEGGAVVFFPSGQQESRTFHGTGWGPVEQAPEENPFRILRWEENEGPLARTDEGFSLPLADLAVDRRQGIIGERTVLASFQDGTPFLVRRTSGRGHFYFCASLPNPEWSSLGNGVVLVPMIQRIMQAGSGRLQQVSSIACGELSAVEAAKRWVALDSETPRQIHFHAGVYQSGDQMIAVNRPAREEEREFLELDEAGALFGSLSFQLLGQERRRAEALQGEIWRFFLIAMLAFLLVESALVLPARPATSPEIKSARPSPVPEPIS
jgi:hypothetical protein